MSTKACLRTLKNMQSYSNLVVPEDVTAANSIRAGPMRGPYPLMIGDLTGLS